MLFCLRRLLIMQLAFFLFFLSVEDSIASQQNKKNTDKAIVTIQPDQIIGNVNREILGNNIICGKHGFDAAVFNQYGGGVWDPIRKKFHPSFMQALKEAGVSVLRWPGGSYRNKPKWYKLIGDLKDRKEFLFGLDEFLSLCENIGAQALITLPADNNSQTADELADLVEYLNSPDNGVNPNGGIDWAHKRAEHGRSKPWNVEYFEFGNENYVSNMTSSEYANNYMIVRKAIKIVDPHLKLGVILEDSTNFKNGWSVNVLEKINGELEFVAIHPYIPMVGKKASKYFTKKELLMATMASDADFINRFEGVNQLIKKTNPDRDDIFIAATEYNGHFVQDEPLPFRFSLMNAIHVADAIRIMLNPSYNVKVATIWHLSNSYWGMIRGGYGTNLEGNIRKEANFYVFEMFNKYLGEYLINEDSSSPHLSYSGGVGISPRIETQKSKDESHDALIKIPKQWYLRAFNSGNQFQKNGIVKVQFDGQSDADYYHAMKSFQVKPNTIYSVSVKVKTEQIQNGKVGIALQDSRGWNRTYFQPYNIDLAGTTPWKWVTVDYHTSLETDRLTVLARRRKSGTKISGTAYFGDIKVETHNGNLGGIESVVSLASFDKTQKQTFLILINKNMTNETDIDIFLKGGFIVNTAEVLTAKSPYMTNRDNKQKGFVYIKPQDVKVLNSDGHFSTVLPPLSMVGISWTKVQAQQ